MNKSTKSTAIHVAYFLSHIVSLSFFVSFLNYTHCHHHPPYLG